MTECRYILLRMNYFSRFVWARFYVYCSMIESTNLMNNLIASVFEWSKVVYSDNESHFTRFEFEELLKAKRVTHFTTSVNHSSSVELIERMIQLMIEDIRKRYIQRRDSEAWALNVVDETIAINIKRVRVHDHRSCDIMLKFVSKTIHHDIAEMKSIIWKNEMKNLFDHAQNVMIALRAKNKILILEIMIRYQNKKESEEKEHESKRKIKKENLVLVRNKVRDNQKKRKLNVRWKESRMMMKKTQHDLSAWVKSLYEVEKATRYHINDLRSWVKRKMNEEWSTTQLISEFQQNQNIDEDEKNQLITTIQTMNEIESFRASLTFEMRRRAMIFANYSDQRSLLL